MSASRKKKFGASLSLSDFQTTCCCTFRPGQKLKQSSIRLFFLPSPRVLLTAPFELLSFPTTPLLRSLLPPGVIDIFQKILRPTRFPLLAQSKFTPPPPPPPPPPLIWKPIFGHKKVNFFKASIGTDCSLFYGRGNFGAIWLTFCLWSRTERL